MKIPKQICFHAHWNNG